MTKKSATIGFGTEHAETYQKFNSLTEALRFAIWYEDEPLMFNLMFEGNEYFNPKANVKRIEKENRNNV